MRTYAIMLLALVAACQSQPAAPGTDTPTRAQTPAAPASSNPASRYFSVEELRALGSSAPGATARETVVCSADGTGECVCLAPLDCSQGGCMTYQENVAAFRQALERPSEGRTVKCERAETGRCDDFRYFDFEGDLQRHELRWFDEKGALVGQRNATDYNAYCGGRTRVKYQGRLPRCEKTSTTEHICGEDKHPARTPFDDLSRFTARRG